MLPVVTAWKRSTLLFGYKFHLLVHFLVLDVFAGSVGASNRLSTVSVVGNTDLMRALVARHVALDHTLIVLRLH
jgi:hypothetical protein